MKKRLFLISIVVVTVFFTFGCQKNTPVPGSDAPSEPVAETPNTFEKKADETTFDKVSSYMKEESKNAFSPYYELLDYKISNYKEEVVNGNIEATFFYTLISKNYDKDPDTVEYIKEAKESGNKNYQQMYDEYLEPKEMNFDLKIVIDENDVITLYSNISPHGIEWEETKMTDYILSSSEHTIYGAYIFEEVSYLSPLSSATKDYVNSQMKETKYTIREDLFKIESTDYIVEFSSPKYVKEEISNETSVLADVYTFIGSDVDYQYTIYDKDGSRTKWRLYVSSDNLWIGTYVDNTSDGSEIVMDIYKLTK